MRPTGAGVNAANIHQDIITGTVMQRPGLNGLLDVIRPGDVLMVNALDRLGRDTLGLLEPINRLAATMSVDLKVLDMPVDAQDVAGGGQLVALVTAGVAAIERANQPTDEAGAGSGSCGGQAGRAALEHHTDSDAHHTPDEEGPGYVPGPDRPESGSIGIAGAAGPEGWGRGGAAATAFKDGWD